MPIAGNPVFEIGGADQVSYADLIRAYARQRGMRRLMIPVPVLTPFLSSLWLGLVTPLYARVGRKLIESIAHPTVVRNHQALRTFDIRPMGVEEAIRRALTGEERALAASRWSDSFSSSGRSPSSSGIRFGTRLVDSRTARVERSRAIAFKAIQRIGGRYGWYAWNGLWQLRGFLDLLVGGVGMRRGRPEIETLQTGDIVDCWRVDRYEPDCRLRLVAEMKLPGRAWLEFEVSGDGPSTMIRQTAVFDPVGLGGRLYWYALRPLHQLVFGGMLRGLTEAIRRFPETGAPPAG